MQEVLPGFFGGVCVHVNALSYMVLVLGRSLIAVGIIVQAHSNPLKSMASALYHRGPQLPGYDGYQSVAC